MRRFLLGFSVLVLITSAAHCQDTADAAMKRRLALAQQYEDLTNREKRIEHAFADQLRLTWDGCTDDSCRAALNQAIVTAVKEGAPEHEQATVRLFASRLTEDELHAAIEFAQSPQGRAIVAAEFEMSGDFATIAHTFSKNAFESVHRSFCPAHPDACARVLTGATKNPSGRP